ncbi:MAG: 2Fe-2S iron-sulfur cluster-binding protein [Ilumatobacteraceae bacterium]
MSTDTTVGLQVRRSVQLTIDEKSVTVAEGTTLLSACKTMGTEIPTLCYGDTITPKNACRVCMVEVEGSRVLVPSCSRPAEPGMVVHTDTERTRHSRKLVLELLGTSVDLSLTKNVQRWNDQYGADPSRFGAPAAPTTDRDQAVAGHHRSNDGSVVLNVHQPVKIDNELYIRDYSKCILCYQCVDACGEQWQNTFAIGVAGRGFDARISTEFAVDLTDSACVYCGNCIQVCPTGALMFTSEYTMRQDDTWDEEKQTETDTICPYCGVGCALTLHVQDNEIVKVTSPSDHSVTHGNLCIKGRFGFQHVQNRPQEEN